MKKIYVKIEGIHCLHCETVIRHALLQLEGVADVRISGNIACVRYEGVLNKEDIVKTITDLDYITKKEYISEEKSRLSDRIKPGDFMLILICILAAAYFSYKIFGYNILNVIPTIDSSITYGMLVVTGMLTSIHCVGMCGAINLSAALNKESGISWKRPLMYNFGRVVSYTVIGLAVGFAGQVIRISTVVYGIIIILAAIIMLMMALGMLGIIGFRLPGMKIRAKTHNSFIIGLLNGFMPCGPLQAMQMYALSTGSAVTGALSMFLFGIGTVPLMLVVGVAVNLARGKRKLLINRIASVLILVLSVSMLNRGLSSINIDFNKYTKIDENYEAAVMHDGYQVVELDLYYNTYGDFVVQKDIPVKMIVNVDKKYLTGCNETFTLKEYGKSCELVEGENIIEFTPTETGVFAYACWMDMIRNNIKVIDDMDYFARVN